MRYRAKKTKIKKPSVKVPDTIAQSMYEEGSSDNSSPKAASVDGFMPGSGVEHLEYTDPLNKEKGKTKEPQVEMEEKRSAYRRSLDYLPSISELIKIQEYELVTSFIKLWQNYLDYGENDRIFRKGAQHFMEVTGLFFFKIHRELTIGFEKDGLVVNGHFLEGKREGDNFDILVRTFFIPNCIKEICINCNVTIERIGMFFNAIIDNPFNVTANSDELDTINSVLSYISSITVTKYYKESTDLDFMTGVEVTVTDDDGKMRQNYSSLNELEKSLYSYDRAAKQKALRRLLEIEHDKIAFVLDRYMKELIYKNKKTSDEEFVYVLNKLIESEQPSYVSIAGKLILEDEKNIRYKALYLLSKIKNTSAVIPYIIEKIESDDFFKIESDELLLFLQLVKPDNFHKTLLELEVIFDLEGPAWKRSQYREMKEIIIKHLSAYPNFKNVTDWLVKGYVKGNKETAKIISENISIDLLSEARKIKDSE